MAVKSNHEQYNGGSTLLTESIKRYFYMVIKEDKNWFRRIFSKSVLEQNKNQTVLLLKSYATYGAVRPNN